MIKFTFAQSLALAVGLACSMRAATGMSQVARELTRPECGSGGPLFTPRHPVSCVGGGTAVCRSGQWICESCNGKDDNADGRIDEGGDALCWRSGSVACVVPRCVPEWRLDRDGPFTLLIRSGAHCVALADDSLCAEDTYACTVNWCDPKQGCVTERNDRLCDDGINETRDLCLPTAEQLLFLSADAPDERGCVNAVEFQWELPVPEPECNVCIDLERGYYCC